MQATLRILGQPRYVLVALSGFVVTLLVLLWLFNFATLEYVLTRPSLTLGEKAAFVLSSIGNVFRYFNDILPVSLLLVSLGQGVVLAQYVWLRRRSRRVRLNQQAKLGIRAGLVGTSCVACSGSILYPLLASFSSAAAGGLALWVGQIVAVAAIVLSVVAVLQMNAQIQKVLG